LSKGQSYSHPHAQALNTPQTDSASQADRRLILYKLKNINKPSAKLVPFNSSEKQQCKAHVLV